VGGAAVRFYLLQTGGQSDGRHQ